MRRPDSWLQLMASVVVLALSACRSGPDLLGATAPEINLSQVGSQSVAVFASSDPDVRATMPVPVCPDGRALAGPVWEVEDFPIEVLVAASHPVAVGWLQLTSHGGVLRSSESSVSVRTEADAGEEVHLAELSLEGPWRRPVRWFTVSLDLRPGAPLARLEAAARDFDGTEGRILGVTVGTLDDLCSVATERP